ncbi:hypothetical protein C2G38_2183874 [Gigaspora rosea]|uniref:Uncharacterized protein n=1 Tax=Gigaspora rosea TaxID=44941 RepID=A0A397VAK1_9GLOM|nr:hypothetical protein C2G38_2183874 [Gigaspora rosea]
MIKKYVELSPIEKKRVDLVSQIEQLPQQEVFAAAHLFNTMRYSKGSNKNEILSPYLQNKAQEFISQNSYKRQSVQSLKEMNHQLLTNNKKLNKKNDNLVSKIKSLGSTTRHLRNQKKHHISQIRSLVQRSSTSSEIFNKKMKSLFKVNKKDYSPNIIWLAIQVSQVGQVSVRSTIECIKLVYEFLIGEPPNNGFQIQL